MFLGRDLIMYILENGLENSPVFENGKFIGFMSENDAAVKFGVGTATIRVWINQGALEGIRIGDTVYIPANSKNPKEIINNEKSSTILNVGDISIDTDLRRAGQLDNVYRNCY